MLGQVQELHLTPLMSECLHGGLPCWLGCTGWEWLCNRRLLLACSVPILFVFPRPLGSLLLTESVDACQVRRSWRWLRLSLLDSLEVPLCGDTGDGSFLQYHRGHHRRWRYLPSWLPRRISLLVSKINLNKLRRERYLSRAPPHICTNVGNATHSYTGSKNKNISRKPHLDEYLERNFWREVF